MVNIQTKGTLPGQPVLTSRSNNKNEVLALSGKGRTALLTAASFDQNYNSQPSYIAQVDCLWV